MMVPISSPHLDWVLIRQAISLSLATGRECRIEGALSFINRNQPFSAFLSDIEEFFQKNDFGHFSLQGNDILFFPKPVRFSSFQISINPYSSAIELMLIMMPSLFQQQFRSRLFLSGATHSPLSFGTSWMKESFLSALEQRGYYASCTLRRFGFYASGGGFIEAKVYPAEARQVMDVRGSDNSTKLTGARIYIAHLESSIAAREKDFLCEALGLSAANAGILEIRDCDGAWNHAEVYAIVNGLAVVMSETVPVYDFSGKFIFSENAIIPSMEKLAGEVRAVIEHAALPEELEREIAIYEVLAGNTPDYISGPSRESTAIAKQFIE